MNPDCVELKEFPGYFISPNGEVWSTKKAGIRRLRPSTTTRYQQVSLYKDGRVHYRKVHVLVLEVFVGLNPGPNYEACHNNGNSLDPRLDNLRWDTRSANYNDRHAHGTHNDGDRNGRAKLTGDQVLQIRRRLAMGEKQIPLAKEYGVTQAHISQIKRRQEWDHI